MEQSLKSTFPNPDAKFAYAIQLLQDSYGEKVTELLEENAKWKALANKQKQQIQHFEDELKIAYQRISDFERNERRLNELVQHNKVELEEVVTERNTIIEKYNALQAHLSHLLEFKKAIFDTVQKDGVTKSVEDELLATPSKTTTSYRSHYTRTTAQNGHKSASTSLFSSPTSSIIYENHSKHTTARSTIPNAGDSLVSDDLTRAASVLYDQIKASISSEDFKLFAENVNKLNNNTQTVQETLDRVSKIVKDPSLLKRFEKLIHDAETHDL